MYTTADESVNQVYIPLVTPLNLLAPNVAHAAQPVKVM